MVIEWYAGQPVIYISEQHLTIADVLSLVVLGRFWPKNAVFGKNLVKLQPQFTGSFLTVFMVIKHHALSGKNSINVNFCSPRKQ